MMAIITNFFIWFLVWIGLSWPVETHEVVVGVIVSIFVSFMTIDVFKMSTKHRKPIPESFGDVLRPFWFIYYAAVFIIECVKANIDVAYRVLHPDLPIRPGTIRVKTSLTSDAGLTFLANSITLTPGTTTVDVDKERGYIYIHWLAMKDGKDGQYTLPVVGRYETILKRIFE